MPIDYKPRSRESKWYADEDVLVSIIIVLIVMLIMQYGYSALEVYISQQDPRMALGG